ncbi:DarT ssDNA thymidine ADP-ribosyltransferase family protein [Hyalangium versicolor]|uniref:DarT ssDNA thymidine ADP-ribosyltransferase family protein n=1 Tax=Hyalangium versicolor TaxID=2861190 RepID=UPI001CCD54B2|nr:DarT ssDNA thymidine ADP-ribosyltransferase family protein [Hyalangium versicolor]
MSRQAIQARANSINVPYLLHFTRVVNLPSIMQHGLYPVSRVATIGVTPQINDELRLDGHLDGTSLSIAFPNHRMFWKYRHANEEVEWVVLAVDPSVLWLKDCAFCRHNAADARISCQPINQLKTPAAFTGMFEEIEGLKTRQEQRLKPSDPTDEQAEVLVFDVIEPSLIFGAAFENAATRDAYQGSLGNRKILVQRERQGYFAARSYVR